MAFNILAPRRPTFPYRRQKSSLATNENAQAAYGDPASGFFGNMPRRTVGGAFGLPITNPDNRLDDAEIIAAGRGNQYAPMNAPPLGAAPADTLGFAAAMGQHNPNGRWFGGALPALGTSFGGVQRPTFFAPPAERGPEMTPLQKAQFAARRGLYYNPQTGVMGGTSRVMDLDRAQFERAAQLGEFPTGQRAKDLAPGSEYLQKNRENYLAQRNQRRSDIASGAFKTPAMKRAEAKERQQQTQFERQFAERNPAAAADVARTKALAAEGQAGRESRERMQKDLLASQERQNKERNDALVRSRGFDPSTGRELGASPLAPPVAALGDKVPQQVQQSARELANSGDVEGARQVLANSGVTDKAEQNKALQEMTGDPMAGLGFWERPVGPGLPGKAPMTRGQALRKLGRAFLPFPWNVAGQ